MTDSKAVSCQPSALGSIGRAARAESCRLTAESFLGDRDMARLAGDAVEPAADRAVAAEIELAFLGHMRVGIERDVGDRPAVADEPSAAFEMPLHHVERGIAPAPLARDL